MLMRLLEWIFMGFFIGIFFVLTEPLLMALGHLIEWIYATYGVIGALVILAVYAAIYGVACYFERRA